MFVDGDYEQMDCVKGYSSLRKKKKEMQSGQVASNEARIPSLWVHNNIKMELHDQFHLEEPVEIKILGAAWLGVLEK